MTSRHRPYTFLIALLLAAGFGLLKTDVTRGQTTASPGTALPHTLLRDPFWPVGWQPASAAQILDESKPGESALTRWEQAAKLLQLTGLSKNSEGKYMGIIKGVGVVQEGDVVAANLGGLTYKWKIRSISPQGLTVDKLGAQPTR